MLGENLAGEVTESGYKERLESVNRTALERPAIEGDSPVYENAILLSSGS